MLEPQIGRSLSGGPSAAQAKRPGERSEVSRQVKSRADVADTSPAREAGKAASCLGLGDAWHCDLMDYGKGINRRVQSMVQKSTENLKKGMAGASQETVFRLAQLKLCQELDSFIRVTPESSEVTKGLTRALLSAVDEGDPGMVAYLIGAGADPLCHAGGVSCLTIATAINDGSVRRSKVVSVIKREIENESR